MSRMTQAELVVTLRELADFYEAHPSVPVMHDLSYGYQLVFLSGTDAKGILRSIGSFRKEFKNDRLIAKKQIGALELRFIVDRAKVCMARVVGTRTVPMTVTPSSFTPEQVVPEHEEEIVEWDCDPVLAGEPEEVGAEVPIPDDIPF